MKRFLSAPLLHFLAAGVVLLGVASLLSRDAGDAPTEGSRRIRVDAAALRDFVRAKTGIEDEAAFAARYAALDAAARRDWVERYVREEALVREARRLGLDRQDDLIRRRLVQQIEFVALGAIESDATFGPDELERIYLERREDYRIPATLSFSHVFVRADSARDAEPARARAEALLGALNTAAAGAAEAQGRGDRFLYNRHYVERTHDEVASHFGDEMAAALSALAPNASVWQGPLRSSHGFHLILLSDAAAARVPAAAEIRELLREDWRRSLEASALDAAVAKIVAGYEIEIEEALDRP